MPNNDAIQQAINDGVLPADPGTGDIVGKFQIENFIKYHILTNVNIAADGNADILSAVTLAKNDNDEALTVNVVNSVGNLRFIDRKERTVPTVYPPDLFLSDRIVLHELNGYLNYNNKIQIMRQLTYSFTLLLFWLCCVGHTAVAQHIVRGKVVDATSKQPLAGVTVSELSADNRTVAATTTDIEGNYALAVTTPLNRLNFSF